MTRSAYVLLSLHKELAASSTEPLHVYMLVLFGTHGWARHETQVHSQHMYARRRRLRHSPSRRLRVTLYVLSVRTWLWFSWLALCPCPCPICFSWSIGHVHVDVDGR